MSTKNKDIKYGKVDLDAFEFETKQVKVRITTMLDEDVLLGLKDIAAERGEKYQSLLNKILRFYVEKQGKTESRKALSKKEVREIVREELRKRA